MKGFMKRLLILLVSAVAVSFMGCETAPKEKVTTVTTSSTTTTTVKPMAAGALSIDPTAGSVIFEIPAHTVYTVEWHVNSGWNQRIRIISSVAGVVEKQAREPFIKSMIWRHQHKTRGVPETITVYMEHKDDTGNWFPSALRTRDLPTNDPGKVCD